MPLSLPLARGGSGGVGSNSNSRKGSHEPTSATKSRPSISPTTSTGPSSTTEDKRPHVPWSFIDCPQGVLISLISHMLNMLMEHNDQVVLTPESLTRFHSRAAPGISVEEYLKRIVKYTNMETIPLLSLLAYIDITCQNLPTFTLSSLTVHRFLIAGVCAGSKAQCDVFCTNAHYAKVGGIKVQELNALEREFLKVTQWSCSCNAELLQRYYTSLVKSHGGYLQDPEPSNPQFTHFPLPTDPPDPIPEGEEPTQADGLPAAVDDRADPDVVMGGEVELAAGMTDGDPGTRAGGEDKPPDPGGREGMVVDQPESLPTAPRSQGMEVDRTLPTPPKSSVSDPAKYPSPDSPASSSIPTSSRSSLRSKRGRPGSISSMKSMYTPPKIAEPKVDLTSATADMSAYIDQQTAQRSRPDPPASNDLASTHTNDPPEPPGPGPYFHPHDVRQAHEHHESQSSHLFRHLVGGIFKRKTPGHRSESPRSSKSPAPSILPETPAHLLHTDGARASPGPKSASTLEESGPSSPSSANPTSGLEQSEPPRTAAQRLLKSPTMVPTRSSPRIKARLPTSPRITRERAHSHAKQRVSKSPGMPKAVTPKIRQRSEDTSEDDDMTGGARAMPRIEGVMGVGQEDVKRPRG